MIKITVKDAAVAASGKIISGDKKGPISGFSVDSRTIKEGDWFLALRGNNSDGSEFITDAVRNGASGVITREGLDPVPDGVGHIVVKDVFGSMWDITRLLRNKCGSEFVSVTGTNGKTTVKDMIRSLLSPDHSVHASPKSYNNKLGVALTIFGLEEIDEFAVLELGTNNKGEIGELAELVRPSTGVITNIGDGHLESFGSRAGVFEEKISLCEFIEPGGTIFLNKDDPFLRSYSRDDLNIKFFGEDPSSDFRIEKITKKENGYDFAVNGIKLYSPLEGEHNISNITAAVSFALSAGIALEKVKERVAGLSLPRMRLERARVNNTDFIIDCYNANPPSFEKAIKVLSDSRCSGKRILIAGDMMELGKYEKELHAGLGSKIADSGIEVLITLGRNSEYIASGAIKAGMSEKNIYSGKDHKEVSGILAGIVDENDIVLLKGSRNMKMEEVLECFTISYTH